MERTLIIDVPTSSATESEFSGLGFTLAHPTALTATLLTLPLWQKLDPKTALLVFPGNGALYVQRTLPGSWLRQWPHTSATACRWWTPGETPVAFAGRIYERGFLLGRKDIILIDDVVSSGATMRRLHKINQPWIPGAAWHAATWIAQESASMHGFTNLIAAHRVGTRATKWPINSLSTLLTNPDIAAVYAQRNFPDSRPLTLLLERLRSTLPPP